MLFGLGDNVDVGPTVQSFISLVTSLGGFGMLALFSYLWYTGRIITAREFQEEKDITEKLLEEAQSRYDKLETEKNQWKDVAIRSLTNNERLQGATERMATIADKALEPVTSKAAQ